MDIGIFNETNEDISTLLNKLEEVLKGTLKQEGVLECEFNVIIVDNKKIHELNKTYRNIDRPTDVISFALEDDETFDAPTEKRILGDIYISIDKVYEQCLEYKHSALRELCFLGVHGLLHLLGYDHMTKEDETVMFGKQEEVLNKYGITR